MSPHLATSGVRSAQEATLQGLVNDLCARNNLRPLDVILYDNCRNAEVNRHQNVIRVSPRLLDVDIDHLLAILAHEIAHARLPLRYQLPLLLLLVIPAVLLMVIVLLIPSPSALGLGLTILAGLFTVGTACVLMNVHAQVEELLCDRFGWQLTGDPAATADALRLLSANPKARRWQIRALHPPTYYRIRLAERASSHA